MQQHAETHGIGDPADVIEIKVRYLDAIAAGVGEPNERILVLGEGEHSYEALLVAEEIEQKGGVAAVHASLAVQRCWVSRWRQNRPSATATEAGLLASSTIS